MNSLIGIKKIDIMLPLEWLKVPTCLTLMNNQNVYHSNVLKD
jgi:hypothetical protein